MPGFQMVCEMGGWDWAGRWDLVDAERGVFSDRGIGRVVCKQQTRVRVRCVTVGVTNRVTERDCRCNYFSSN